MFSLVDIRHDPTSDDENMINYLHHYAIPFTVIATKADKIGKTRIYDRVKSIGNYLAIGEKSVMAVSSESGYGKDKILQKLDDILEVYNDSFYNKPEVEEDDVETEN